MDADLAVLKAQLETLQRRCAELEDRVESLEDARFGGCADNSERSNTDVRYRGLYMDRRRA